MTCNILGIYLPNEILSGIFCENLSIEDFTRFDTAILNKTRRVAFLSLIGSERCIFNSRKATRFYHHTSGPRKFILWVILRCIRLKELACNPHLYENESFHFSNLGQLLQKLKLSSDYRNEDVMTKISKCCNLTQLTMDCRSITDVTLISIANNCRSIIAFTLTFCEFITDCGILKIADSYPDLIELNMSGCEKMTDKSIVRVAECCPNLKHLCLSDYKNMTDMSIIRITECCPLLLKLRLHCCPITDVSGMRVADCYPNLQSIELMYTEITDAAIVRIAESCPLLITFNFMSDIIIDIGIIRITQCCPNLKHLSLFGCENITHKSVKKIAENCPNLLDLNLKDCEKITDLSLIKIAEGCCHLRRLDLGWNKKVSDESITEIAKRCHDLVDIGLSGCRISDISLFAIAQFCPKLEDLDLSNVQKVTHKGIRRIEDSCPKFKVLCLFGDRSRIILSFCRCRFKVEY